MYVKEILLQGLIFLLFRELTHKLEGGKLLTTESLKLCQQLFLNSEDDTTSQWFDNVSFLYIHLFPISLLYTLKIGF